MAQMLMCSQTAPPRQEIPSWGQGKGRWSCYEGPLSGSNLWCLRGRCPWNSTKLDFNSDVAFGNQTWQWMFFPCFRGWSNLNAYLRWICQPVMSQERIPKFGPSFFWKMIFTYIYIFLSNVVLPFYNQKVWTIPTFGLTIFPATNLHS